MACASLVRFWITLILVVLLATVSTEAQSKSRDAKAKAKPSKSAAKSKESGPAEYRSKHFLVHTDLPPDDARELLKKLETMIALISRYWGRPSGGVIECYVVDDLDNWPPGSLNESGLKAIRGGAGVTKSMLRTDGVRFQSKATVFAVAEGGTPLHEAVHAYCTHAFGTCGPVWYAEGMAEMGHYWRENDRSVHCDPRVSQYLRESEPKNLLEIAAADQLSGDSWQNYAWRWALCHLLANNTNYSQRFLPLGIGLLTKQDVSFEQVYGSMDREVSFEYLFFLKHVEPGYRVDLCSWDWKTKYIRPKNGAAVTSKIDAGKGWQPSRLRLTKDEEYEYSAAGKWQLAKDAEPCDANGDSDRHGKLVGIIFEDYQLSEPFELGTHGSFTAPQDGELLLRCNDAFANIADNSGFMKVKLKVNGEGKPLPEPEATAGR
ncbi:MAG: hypothetical protein WD648_10760 [Planctomycetaceae bacterium]